MDRKSVPFCLCLNRDEFQENLKGHTHSRGLLGPAARRAEGEGFGGKQTRRRRDDRGTAGERGRGKGPRRRWSKEQIYVVVGTGARGEGGERNRQ